MDNYSRNSFSGVNTKTGEISNFTHYIQKSHKQLRGLSMGYVNTKAYDFLLYKFNYRKSSVLVLNYIRDNIDQRNIIKFDNISKLTKSLEVDIKVFYKTIKELLEIGFMYEYGKREYQVNPFVFISTRTKRKNDKILLQDSWEQKFGTIKNDKLLKLETLSEIIVNKDEYIEYLKSNEWKEKANQCKIKYDNKCFNCGSSKLLEVHHLSYKNIYNEEPTDVICICHLCHARLHELGNI